MQTGYCGNVHPGRTIEEVKANLVEHALRVKSRVRPDSEMGIGLWLSATAAQELDDAARLMEFRDWLAANGLLPFTLNGFPYGDFHQAVVKHEVYQPTWAETSRLDFTVRLAEILNVLLPEGVDGTISTLPLAWPIQNGRSLVEDEAFWKSCARNLTTCAQRLDNIAQSTGRNIFICIEPEPGCVLDTCEDLVGFYGQHLLNSDPQTNQLIRKHIGVCHDICHSAVMFEDQSTAVNSFHQSDIRIGKVQVSSAVAVSFDGNEHADHQTRLDQLRGFDEPKYLHQTSVRKANETQFYEDLGLALDANENSPEGDWRIHFHVPIFSSSLGKIGSTQSDIGECLAAIQATGQVMPHLEIETYAWNVLPDHLQQTLLSDGIADEIEWFDDLLREMEIEA